MKRTIIYFFLAAFIIGIAEIAKAQTEKGKILLGGQSSLEFTSINAKSGTDYGSDDNGKTRNLEIIPQVGFFIANNLAIGLELPYSFTKMIEDYSWNSASTFSVLPFARYYFGKTNVKPYLHAEIGPGWKKEKVEDSTVGYKDELTSKYTAYGIGGGLGIFINQHVSFDLGLGYASVSSKLVDPNTNMNLKNTASGIGASIGIVVCL